MEKVLLIVVGVVITTIFQFFSVLLIKYSEKKLKHKDQLKLLSGELEDLIRHCVANLSILESMKMEEGMPSNMHFEKMKIMESSILFSSDTYFLIDSKYTRYIHRLRIEIRNINLEIDSVIAYKKTEIPNKDILKKYVDYLISKMKTTINNLPNRLSELMIIDKTVLERINKQKEEAKHTRQIFYE